MFDEAVEVAELGLQRPDCGATRGERLRKRIERCRRKAEALAGAAAASQVGEEESLTCLKCGVAFSRVRTRGRKPKECPSCRE